MDDPRYAPDPGPPPAPRRDPDLPHLDDLPRPGDAGPDIVPPPDAPPERRHPPVPGDPAAGLPPVPERDIANDLPERDEGTDR